MTQFVNDVDMLGTSMENYARNVAREVIGVGRVGTLIDWEALSENRVYLSLYTAENILNWRSERVHGRNVLTLLVLHEEKAGSTEHGAQSKADEFETEYGEQIRVLKLAEGGGQRAEGRRREAVRSGDLEAEAETGSAGQGGMGAGGDAGAVAAGKTAAADSVCFPRGKQRRA